MEMFLSSIPRQTTGVNTLSFKGAINEIASFHVKTLNSLEDLQHFCGVAKHHKSDQIDKMKLAADLKNYLQSVVNWGKG